MTGKEAGGSTPHTTRWKSRLSLLLGALALAGAVFSVRYFWGPDSASAQSGQRAATAAARSNNEPPRGQRAAPQAPRNSHAPASDSTTSDVAAVVNGESITRQQLGQECLRRYGEDVLESMVNKHLIWQACQQQGIMISEKDVEEEITHVASKFGLSRDRWLQMLQQERDITPDKYRRDIIWPTLALRRLAADQIEVSEEEFNRAYESEFGPAVKVRLIVLSDRSLAEEIQQQAAADPNQFGTLAKDHSEDQASASIRGLIPPIRKHLGDPLIERTAFALKAGEVSEVIEVAGQFLILKCDEHVPETHVAPQHLASARQRVRDRVRDEKMRSAATELFSRLQQEARVVNVLNNQQLQEQHPGIAALINDRRITLRELMEECISRHGAEVLEGEINRKILMQQLRAHNTAVTEQDIDREIARAAESYGYLRPDGRPDIDKWLEDVTATDGASVDLYVRDAVWPTVALKKLVAGQVEVTDDDLQKGFVSNFGERVNVLAIVLANQRQATKVWEMARNNPTEEFFAELATTYSIEPVSQANRGKIPPIRQHSGQPQIEREAFNLQPGELSSVIVVEDQYLILKCLGRTDPVVQNFEDVKNELYRDIHEKKLRLAMAREFDRLVAGAQVDNFLTGRSQSGQRVAAGARGQQTAARGQETEARQGPAQAPSRR